MKYDSIDNEFGMFGHDTVIPDDKFGPDEERIFIDDDPYDLDNVVLSIDQLAAIDHPEESVTTENSKPTSVTKSSNDFLENSLKNMKSNNDHESDNFLRSQRGTNFENEKNSELSKTKKPDAIQATTETVIDVFSLIEKSKNGTTVLTSTILSHNNEETIENKITTTRENDKDFVTLATIVKENNESTIKLQKNTDSIDENLKILTEQVLPTQFPDDDDKIFDSGSEMEQIEDSYEAELTKQKLNKNDTADMLTNITWIPDEIKNRDNENTKEDTDLENVDLGALEVVSNEDSSSERKTTVTPKLDIFLMSTKHPRNNNKNHLQNASRRKDSDELSTQLEILSFETDDSVDDESGHLNVFSSGN